MCFSSPGASTRLRLSADPTSKSATYTPAPPSSTRPVRRAAASRLVILATTNTHARATAVSAAPNSSSAAIGFIPSVVIVLLRRCAGTCCRPQRVGLIVHERPGARAAPVPGPPIRTCVVPASQHDARDEAAVFRRELWQRGEQRRHRVRAQGQRILGVERLLSVTRQVRLQDERVGVEEMQTGKHRERLHQRAERKPRPIAAQHGPRKPGERSEEHTSELQSPCNLVCRLLLEKKKKKKNDIFVEKKKKTNQHHE